MAVRFGLFASAVVLAVVAGCSSNDLSPQQKGMPCNECAYGYVPVKHTVERRVWCVKDGKTLDCNKVPAECPECRKIQHQETKPPAE